MSARLALAAASSMTLCSLAARAMADDPSEPSPPDGATEVEVRGTRPLPRSARDPSGASRVVRGERLRAPGATAAEVLAEVPGVQVARSGSAADLATASIRGATSAEIPVYLAGVRLNDDVTGIADLSLVPLWMLDRIEVHRSGAPADADRMGIGGAIFFEPRLPANDRAGAGLGVGSFGERAAWAAAELGGRGAGAMVGVRGQRANNDYPYIDDRGTTATDADDFERRRPNADYEQWDVWSIGRVTAGAARLTTVVNGLAREQGTTGLGVIPASAARTRVQRGLGAVSASLPCAGDDSCRLEVGTAAVVTRTRLDDPQRELGLLTTSVDTSGARLGERARVELRLRDSWTVGAGVSQDLERLGIDERDGASLRARRAVTRAAASLALSPAPWMELGALGAVERHGTTAALGVGQSWTEDDDTVTVPAGRIGARVSPYPGWALFANAGRYARVPTLGERYGVSAVVRGSPGLEPERGTTVDAGTALDLGDARVSFAAELFAFARFADDLVAYRASSFGMVRPYNVASARLLGVEAAAALALASRLRLGLALTATDPRDVTAGRALGNDFLPFQARLVVAPEAELGAGPWPALGVHRASVGARLLYRASRAADPPGLIVLPAQAPLDLHAAAFFHRGRLALRLAVSDVLDEPLHDAVGLPLPGRSFHGSTEVWW
ncbi:MAG: TonB-dependent receptor [Polyangiaceae bacterium]